MGYSGDMFIAADNAAEGTEISYLIPEEGDQIRPRQVGVGRHRQGESAE